MIAFPKANSFHYLFNVITVHPFFRRNSPRDFFAHWLPGQIEQWNANAPAMPEAPTWTVDGGNWRTTLNPNQAFGKAPDSLPAWEAYISEGRDYLCGSDCEMEAYLKGNTTSMNDWQQMAFHWAKANPAYALRFSRSAGGGLRFWTVSAVGEFVTFGFYRGGYDLKHASLNGLEMILVDRD